MTSIIQITDPDENTNDLHISIGIDLGTSNSLLVAYSDDEITILDAIPSTFYFDEQNMPIVGEALRRDSIFSVKRLLAASREDMNSLKKKMGYEMDYDEKSGVVIHVGDKVFTPLTITRFLLAYFLKKTQLAFPDHEGNSSCVITIPAWFNEQQRRLTHSAAVLAGWHVLRLIHEPTSAVIASTKDNNNTHVSMVIDCGGGTTDISIVSVSDSAHKVELTNGDNQLGGDDVDFLIFSYLYSDSCTVTPEIKAKIKALKEELSTGDTASITIASAASPQDMTRSTLKDISKPFIDTFSRLLKKTSILAKEKKLHIDTIIPVGGMCKMKMVIDTITSLFPGIPLGSTDPLSVVGVGAAIHAHSLQSGEKESRILIDCMPMSVGIEVYGGVMEVILPRLSPIPSMSEQFYTNWADNQTGMDFTIYQGEHPIANKNHCLGTFTLEGLPQQKTGTLKVKTLFQVDADGVLTITAEEVTGQAMTTYQVSRIDQAEGAKAEIKEGEVDEARLVTLRISADMLIKHLDQLAAHLPFPEEIVVARADLNQALSGQDIVVIQKSIDELEKIGKPYSSKALDLVLSSSVRGKSVTSFN